MISKDSVKMKYLTSGSMFFIVEYINFLTRWKVSSIFFSQRVAVKGTATLTLWVSEKEYDSARSNVQFVAEEKQILKLLSEVKSLLISIEISDQINEELIKENNMLLGLDA